MRLRELIGLDALLERANKPQQPAGIQGQLELPLGNPMAVYFAMTDIPDAIREENAGWDIPDGKVYVPPSFGGHATIIKSPAVQAVGAAGQRVRDARWLLDPQLTTTLAEYGVRLDYDPILGLGLRFIGD